MPPPVVQGLLQQDDYYRCTAEFQVADAKMQEWPTGYKAKCQLEDERTMLLTLMWWNILKASL